MFTVDSVVLCIFKFPPLLCVCIYLFFALYSAVYVFMYVCMYVYIRIMYSTIWWYDHKIE